MPSLRQEIEDMLICNLRKEISRTILAKGRNHGAVSVRMENFPKHFFESWFNCRSKQWKRKASLSRKTGYRTHSIKIGGKFERLDKFLGSWREMEVNIPLTIKDGTLNDGKWILNENEHVVVFYNETLASLNISFRIMRFNRFGVFQ